MEQHEPVEIVRKTDQTLVGYACGKCGIFFSAKLEEDTRQLAKDHCARVCHCGEPLESHYLLLCSECQRKKEAEREKARFEKAEKISIEDYDGPVCWNDEWFSSIDDLLDHCESSGFDVPEYVWATEPQTFKLSAEDIIERELELQEMHEDAYDCVGTKAKETLQAFLDVWCKELNLVSYFENTKKAVLLRPDAVAAAG